MDSRIICLAGHFARLGGMEAADAFSLNADAAIACDVYGLLVDKIDTLELEEDRSHYMRMVRKIIPNFDY